MEHEQNEIDGNEAEERLKLLEQLQEWLEAPMMVLAFVWLGFFVIEVAWGLNRFLELMGYAIWAMFVLQFVLEFALAPVKRSYLRSNWLTALALALPALRMFNGLRVLRFARVARTAQAARGARFVRIISSLNRGMRALRSAMSRRGFGYVVLLTLIVDFAGAAGMFAFESEEAFDSYASALWWTSMLITTIASDFWPQTPEGRLLCLFLSLYGLAVFGYVTATLATFFIGRDAEDAGAELAGERSLAALRQEIAAMHEEVRKLAR